MGTTTCAGGLVVGNISGWKMHSCVVGSLDDNGELAWNVYYSDLRVRRVSGACRCLTPVHDLRRSVRAS